MNVTLRVAERCRVGGHNCKVSLAPGASSKTSVLLHLCVIKAEIKAGSRLREPRVVNRCADVKHELHREHQREESVISVFSCDRTSGGGLTSGSRPPGGRSRNCKRCSSLQLWDDDDDNDGLQGVCGVLKSKKQNLMALKSDKFAPKVLILKNRYYFFSFGQ